jgi:intein/homing endonuclease
MDPVYFCAKYLKVDGKPLDLIGTGYKPFQDIYRYIGISAMEKNSKPIVMVKGRQVGATTMAAALECYFIGCNRFGTYGRSPMRMMHLFPTLSLAAAYTKDKLDPMIGQAAPVPGTLKKNGLPKSFMENIFDSSSPANDSMHFKKFMHGNQIWIESTGLDGDRVRGRLLNLETELPTPTGFIKLKDLKEGDDLFDDKGDVCKCIKLHPIRKSPESYKVTFDDGTTVDACADHLWLTYTKKDRNVESRNNYKLRRRIIRREQGKEYKPFLERINRISQPTVKTTKEILETLKCGIEYNHSIPIIPFAKYSEKELLIDPYILGAWLGDGTSISGIITSADPEIFEGYDYHLIPSSENVYNKNAFSKDGYSKSNNYRISGLTSKLRKLNLLNNKHIPDIYLKSSYEQRLALLQGLMDTDGCCYKDGRCEFTQIVDRKTLVFQIKELISSLGIKCRIKRKKSLRYNVRYKDKYQILFITTKPVFRLDRKLKHQKNNSNTKQNHRFIRSIEPIESVSMRCITVDSPSSLYLITRSYIATHNTCDCVMFDECFPYNQLIDTNIGKIKIGKVVDLFNKGQAPLVNTYNESSDIFEYKQITNSWNRGKRKLIQVQLNNRKIKCTQNHPFLTTKGWVKAKDLVSGNLVLTSPTEAIQISKQLNSDQYQIVLGSFLGDGHISKHGQSRYRLCERHGIDQSEYCLWKASMFGAKTTIIDHNGFSGKPAIFFETKLFGLEKDFPKTKTSCPQWVLDDLDERGLAIWFMDDGTKRGVISTCSFDEDSQTRIVNKLKSFGIDCEYRSYNVKSKNTKYFSIYLSSNGYNKICSIISKYIHQEMSYKISTDICEQYNWNSSYKSSGLIPVKSINFLNEEVEVYDIEVKDNHNFIACSVCNAKDNSGIIVHNCQDMNDLAIGAATKILAKSNYGTTGQGLQVYFGTPKTKGGSYWEMWKNSSQQYFHLRCEKCGSYFPLYRPDTNWEDVWIYGMTVRCTDCAHEQDKNEAVERGKWIPLNNPDECDFVGYHFNQLYIPTFTRETIIKAKPDRSPINTERVYMNEVLGEFYDGEGGTITTEQIRTKCIDKDRRMVKYIHSDSGKRVYAGFDWGQRGALEQLSGRGGKKGSYSCAVILTAQDNIFNIEFATRLMKADPETKEGAVEEMFRRYNMTLAIGDIGDAYDLTHRMQRTYDERFLASRAQHRVIGHVKYSADEWPKTIVFEKDYYIGELLGLLKEGRIKFPGGHHHKVEWLIEHCASMDIKVTKDKSGEPLKKYVKGSGANDGLMALLNAYLAWKFDVTQGFSIANPLHMKYEIATEAHPIQAVIGYIPRMNGRR